MATIGNTSEFANYDWTWEGSGSDSVRGIQVTMPEDGTADSITAFVTTNDAARTVVYSLFDGSGNLLGQSSESAGSHAAGEELTLALAEESAGSLDITSGTTLYICVSFSAGSGAGAVANDGSSNVAYGGDNQSTYPDIGGPIVFGSADQPDYSIYLTYTASGGGSDPAPNLESAVADMTAIRATTFTYDFTSHFSDSQSLAYTVTGAPSGWDLDASAGTVTYTHTGTDVSNSPFTPHVIATDTDGNAVTSSFTLTVRHPKMAFEASASTQIIERSNGALLSRTLHYQIMGSADPVGYAGNYDDGSATFASGEYTFTLTSVDISAGEQGAIVLYDPNDGDTRRYVLSAF